MRRLRKTPSSRLLAESQRLVLLSQALMQAGSRIEERSWERLLDALVLRLLKSNHQDVIEAALDQLFEARSDAYDALMEALESASESAAVEHEGIRYDALLIAIPILCWTRFAIPTGQVPPGMLEHFKQRLSAHILAADTLVTISPAIYSIDQLPRGAAELHALTQKIALAAVSGTGWKQPASSVETPPFLADARFLIAAVAAREGQPLFQWQTVDPPHDVAARQAEGLIRWRAEMTSDLNTLFPGCSVELSLPNAFAHALRLAEKDIRPSSILAADYFLTQTLNIASTELQANIGAFVGEGNGDQIEEYRIGFSIGQETDIVYGVVWPLFGPEITGGSLEPEAYEKILPPSKPAAALQAPMPPLEEIHALLRQAGITRIQQHDDLYSMEFCEDCGAPLYPDPNGDLVHAELPEDAPTSPGHFH